jgi:hypothetical protein
MVACQRVQQRGGLGIGGRVGIFAERRGLRAGEGRFEQPVIADRGADALLCIGRPVRQAGLRAASNPPESIDLLTVRLISADFVANALRAHPEGYNVRSDGGDEARCGRCYTTTVRR